jgi:hypothetical protein
MNKNFQKIKTVLSSLKDKNNSIHIYFRYKFPKKAVDILLNLIKLRIDRHIFFMGDSFKYDLMRSFNTVIINDIIKFLSDFYTDFMKEKDIDFIAEKIADITIENQKKESTELSNLFKDPLFVQIYKEKIKQEVKTNMFVGGYEQ